MKVHLVLYAQGEPYETTRNCMIDTVPNNVIVHVYNLERMKNSMWFYKIHMLPRLPEREGKRDGYYTAYKAHIVKEVYDTLDEGDKLMYFDCSRYFVEGFMENLDKYLSYDMICGGAATDFKNFTALCCQDKRLWDAIDYGSYRLFDLHINASFMMFTKNQLSTKVINEYAQFSVPPYVMLHITTDQAILNIIAYKYNLPVFFHKDVKHFDLRNKNNILKYVNTYDDVIVPIHSINPLGYPEPFERKWDKILVASRFCDTQGNCFVSSKKDEFSKIFKNIDTTLDINKKYSFMYIDEDEPDLWKYLYCNDYKAVIVVDRVGVKESVNRAVSNFIEFTDSIYDIFIYVIKHNPRICYN